MLATIALVMAAKSAVFAEGPAGFTAVSSSQRLTVEVDDGLSLTTEGGERLSLVLSGIGRRGRLAKPGPGAVDASGAQAEILRSGSVEWIRVDEESGVEHGATIVEPPGGPRGEAIASWTLAGTLSPRPTPDGRAIRFVTAAGKPAIRYAELAVRDAAGTRLPSRFEVRFNEVRIVFDDRDAVYPVTIDPIATTADFVQDSDQATAYYGFAVATAGDVNGDGYSDIVVGAYMYNGGQSGEGRVSIYHGSASGLSTTAARTLERDQADAHFGFSVASAGDFNNDGFDDIVVGAPDYGTGGAIFVYFGSASGIGTSPGFTFSSAQSGASFGTAVSGAGDVNGDGFDDIIVGAPLWNGTVTDEGAAFVFEGGATNPTTWSWMVEPTNEPSASFGNAVSGAGDVNGDGFADVVVGAPFHDLGQSNEGSITVYHGSGTGLSTTFARQVGSNLANANLGRSVAAAGDVNGDGYADIVAGAPRYTNGQGLEGRVYVFHGSSTGIGASASRIIEEDQTGAELGWSVATAGDLNADGYADIVAGAHLWTNGQSDEGAAFAYLGGPSGIAATSSWSREGGEVGAEFGRAVATAGDTDGDGFSELLIGSPLEDNGQADEGMARTYAGTGDVPSSTAERTWLGTGDTALGRELTVLGDVNGDGYSDAATGVDTDTADGETVRIYLGSATGLPAAFSLEIPTPAGDFGIDFGRRIAAVGDVNGDGYDDMLVAAPWEQTFSGSGHAYLYLGSASGLSTTPAWTHGLGQSGSDVDEAKEVVALGDINGDGYADWGVAKSAINVLDVFHGGPTLPDPHTPAYFFDMSNIAADQLCAGDYNGDGFSDLVAVGQPAADSIFFGGRDGLTQDAPGFTVSGTRCASVGDVNGDGYADLLTSNSFFSNGENGEGRLQIWFGSATGISATPAWSDESNEVGGELGLAIAAAGDVDSDGYSDFIAATSSDIDCGECGDARLYLGSAGLPGSSEALRIPGTTHNGVEVAGGGDFNGDGFDDVLFAEPDDTQAPQFGQGTFGEYLGDGLDAQDHRARMSRVDHASPIALLGKSDSATSFRILALTRPAAGRNDVRLDHEAVALGTPFGAAIVKGSYFDSGTPGSNGSDINFDRLVSGLAGGIPHHFRFRFTNRNPLFPRTRWLKPAGNGIQQTDLCMPSNWYKDLDGDHHGDPNTSVFQCASPTGWLANGDDCDDASNRRFPGNPEICDNVDNDCDTQVDEGIAAPTGSQTIKVNRFSPGSSTAVITIWTSTGAVSERSDMSRGFLSTLRSGGGDFTSSYDICQANDASTDVSVSTNPPAGDGFWILSRAVNCSGVSHYEDGSASQQGTRTAEILAAPGTCP